MNDDAKDPELPIRSAQKISHLKELIFNPSKLFKILFLLVEFVVTIKQKTNFDILNIRL